MWVFVQRKCSYGRYDYIITKILKRMTDLKL